MAKKKSTSKGINLLNGITGSKLAKLATLIIVLLAIPLTVMMSSKQQNIQQEASIVAGGGGTSTCRKVTSTTTCKTYEKKIYKTNDGYYCCVKCSLPVFNSSGNIVRHGGVCITGTSYSDTRQKCEKNYGSFASITSGQCPGGVFTLCCIPGSINCAGSYDSPTTADQKDNACQFINTPCKGTFFSGACRGPAGYKCCDKVYK